MSIELDNILLSFRVLQSQAYIVNDMNIGRKSETQAIGNGDLLILIINAKLKWIKVENCRKNTTHTSMSSKRCGKHFFLHLRPCYKWFFNKWDRALYPGKCLASKTKTYSYNKSTENIHLENLSGMLESVFSR